MNELTDLMYEFCMRGGTIEMSKNLNTGAFECRMETMIGGEQKGSLMRVIPQERAQLDAVLRSMFWQFNLEWTRQRVKEAAEVVDAWPQWKKNCLAGAYTTNESSCAGCKGAGSVRLGGAGKGSFMVTCRHCYGSGRAEVKND